MQLTLPPPHTPSPPFPTPPLSVYQVCDDTCGQGRFGDYNCNWRALGTQCRYCFDNVQDAREADQIAQKSGGRVIMCDTHEPPHQPVRSDLVEDGPAAMVTANVKAAEDATENNKVQQQ